MHVEVLLVCGPWFWALVCLYWRPASRLPRAVPRVAPPALILRFTVKPETVHPGQRAVLSWATENPIGVTIDPEVGPVTARGIKQVFPTATTTYTLKVGGPNDAVLTKTVTVTVTGAAAGRFLRLLPFQRMPACPMVSPI